jgi:hypothetical protein
MKKLILLILVTVAFLCYLQGQIFAQSKSSFSSKKWDKFEERTLQIRMEFNRHIRNEEPNIDFNDHVNYDRYVSNLKYWFRNVYPHRDTIGSQQLFEQALSPHLQKAVRYVLETTEDTSDVAIYIFEKNGTHYCRITPIICVLGGGEEGENGGYLLYRNNILVEIHYDSKELAALVMKPDELKELPYDWFLPVEGEWTITNYDGPSDYYRIGRKGKLKFLGRLDYWEEVPRELSRYSMD